MKKFQFLPALLWMFLVTSVSFSQDKLKAYIDTKYYSSPEVGTYVEINYQFLAYTTKFVSYNNVMTAKVAISANIIDQKGDTVLRNAYAVESSVSSDSIIEDFFSIQRLPLAKGKYRAIIELIDLNKELSKISGEFELNVPDFSSLSVSDILVAEVAVATNKVSEFYKSGYEMIPKLSNFFDNSSVKMPYYFEIYNSNQMLDSVFGLQQKILDKDFKEVPGYSKFTKMKPAEVIPYFRNLDISKLATGEYQLIVQVLNRNNEELCTPVSYFFDRYNELQVTSDLASVVLDPAFQASLTKDSVNFYLGSLIPIAKQTEVKSILALIKEKNEDKSRKYFQQFWSVTAPNRQVEAWLAYKQQVMQVQRLYSNNFQDGYETDRGRVYLQYGAPNEIITRETSPTEYPYEIWHYYKIKQFSNRRFVFYNPDLVNNAYRLLHSDMVGELKNNKWQEALTLRSTPSSGADEMRLEDNWGSNSNYYYRQY